MAWDARIGGGSAAKTEGGYGTAILDYVDSTLLGEGVRYVSDTGSDGYDGLTDRTPMRSVQAAYNSLPTPASDIAAVQKIVIAPGDYDGGASPVLAKTRGKPIWLAPTVGVPPYVTSTLTAPLTDVKCARFRTTAASHITMVAGTAGDRMLGNRYEDILFEFRAANTKIGIDANSGWYGDIRRCYGFGDKTSIPAAVDAQLFYIRDDATYGGAGTDNSWWRIYDNDIINIALGTLGDTGGNNNQHVVMGNRGLGIGHANTSALPFLSCYQGHRLYIAGNNIEAYNKGILMDRCYGCTEIGNGGEFVDYFLDLYSIHGCDFAPQGITFKSLGTQTILVSGARLVRMDQFCKNNVFRLFSVEAASFTNGLYNPIDDATNPCVEFNGVPGTWGPNEIISGAFSSSQSDVGGTSTTTPGAVTTVNIAHGLGTTPLKFSAQAANANARGAPAFYVSADATNVILNFASAVTGATSYAWAWRAKAR